MNRVVHKSVVGLAVVLALFCAPCASAAEESHARIVAALQKKYESLTSLAADFEQKNEIKALGRTTKSSGRLLLAKPGRLRVEYEKPERQLLVSDGRTFWLHTPRFNQVVISEVGNAGAAATPLLFLAGKGEIEKNFRVFVEKPGVAGQGEGARGEGAPHRLRLEPRSGAASFRRMWLEVEPENFRILAFSYVDALGNKSGLRFSNVRESVKIAEEKFRFVAPPGAEIVRTPGRGGR